jgi:hypothetical protein
MTYQSNETRSGGRDDRSVWYQVVLCPFGVAARMALSLDGDDTWSVRRVRKFTSGVVPAIPKTVRLAVDGIGVRTDAPGHRTSLRGVDYERSGLAKQVAGKMQC